MDVETSYSQPPPPRYMMLSENGGDPNLRPPPYRRNIPPYYSKHSKRSSGCSCCRFICCCCCFLLLIIVVLSILFFYIYNYFDPKIPSYKVTKLDIAAFDAQPDFSLYTEFVVTVKAENPNDKVSVIYGKDSKVVVTYSGSVLCNGKLPSFHQGFLNTTIIKVVLKGKSDFGSGLQEALMDNRKTGRIPLDVYVRAPVSIVLRSLELKQVKVLVHCSLVVDNLSPNKRVDILSSKYDVKVDF